MAKGHGKRDEKPYGIVVGRTVVGKDGKPFQQVLRMSWSLVDVDASRAAGKCRPDVWKKWCTKMKVYNTSKLGPKDTPPEMFEFVLIEDQKEPETGTPGKDEEPTQALVPVETDDSKSDVDDVEHVEGFKTPKGLKCPDYFFKTENLKRQSKKPELYVDEFAAPATKVLTQRLLLLILLLLRNLERRLT